MIITIDAEKHVIKLSIIYDKKTSQQSKMGREGMYLNIMTSPQLTSYSTVKT